MNVTVPSVAPGEAPVRPWPCESKREDTAPPVADRTTHATLNEMKRGDKERNNRLAGVFVGCGLVACGCNGSPMEVGEQASVARPHRCDAGLAVSAVVRV